MLLIDIRIPKPVRVPSLALVSLETVCDYPPHIHPMRCSLLRGIEWKVVCPRQVLNDRPTPFLIVFRYLIPRRDGLVLLIQETPGNMPKQFHGNLPGQIL
jgi:hypothetical protein